MNIGDEKMQFSEPKNLLHVGSDIMLRKKY
jgi:hypothetical protein